MRAVAARAARAARAAVAAGGVLGLAALTACTVDAKHAVDGGAVGDDDDDHDAAPGDAGPDGPADDRAPETTITSAPEVTSDDASPTFAFTADEPATFICSIDGENPLGCTSPYTRALAGGAHTFSVRAVDHAGNSDGTPAEHVWTIDTVAPETMMTAAPPAADNSVVVVFAFTSNEPSASFDCSLDGDGYLPCASGDAVGPLADGPHSFAVRARDAAGNIDPSPSVHAWVVDSSSPDTLIVGGPAGPTDSTTATFTFVSPDAGGGATFQCALDDAPLAACTSPRSYAGLSEDEHSFAVRVTDAVGNVDPTPATRAWSVDLSAPDTTITDGPEGAVALASASFAFTADEAGVTFACRLDGGAWDDCDSPHAITSLGQGSHTFAVRATDAADHVETSPATRTWTVDTIPPDTTIVGGPPAQTSSGMATFDFTTTEPGATFECSLDGATFAACGDPYTLAVGDGAHTLEVCAIDVAGNHDASPAARTWSVDTVAPAISITGGPAAGSTSGPYVTFSFTASEPAIACSVDGGSFAACTSPASYSLPAGAHTFQVRVTDDAGNPATASRAWTVACAPPTSGGGAVGVFHLDEGAGVQVMMNATGGADAVLGDDVTAETADPWPIGSGRFGAALGFDADEQDHLTWSSGGMNSAELTIELWARPDEDAGAQDVLVSGDGRVALRAVATGGAVRFAITVVRGNLQESWTATSAPVAPDAWHHVLASVAEPTLRLWVDGEGVEVDGLNLGGAPDLEVVRVGADATAYDGDLDELYLSETAITTDAAALARYCPP